MLTMDIVGARDYSDDGRASVRRYGNDCASAPHGSSTRVLCDPVRVFVATEHFTLGGKCCRYADILSQFVTVDAKCCCCAKVFSLLAPNVSIATICCLFDIVRFSSLNDSVPHATTRVYDRNGKDFSFALCGSGTRMLLAEYDPFCALQTCR